MNFVLTTIDRGEIREFAIFNSVLEQGLDDVSRLAVFCDQLLSVKLVASDSVYWLPPQAFDGQPLSPTIAQLEQQWQAVLSEPAALAIRTAPPVRDWYAMQVTTLQTTITAIHRLIDTLTANCQWLQTAPLKAEDRCRFLSRNECSLAYFQQCLVAAQQRQQTYRGLSGP